jgi:hypothetical protein
MLDTKTGPLPDLSIRRPGPIPSIDRVDSGDEPSYRVPTGLETGFKLLLSLSLPFIVYVLSWKAGVDLATVAYALVVLVMAAATILSWEPARGRVPEIWVAAVKGNRPLRWLPLQAVPVVGFELWRHTTAGSVYGLVPLLAITWAFVATAGTARSLTDS